MTGAARNTLLLFLVAGGDGTGDATRRAMRHDLVCGVPGATLDLHGSNLEKSRIELQRAETVIGVAVSEPPLTPTVQLIGDTLRVSLDGAPQGAYDVTAVA